MSEIHVRDDSVDELEDFLGDEFDKMAGRPRSVGEAVAETQVPPQPAPPREEEPERVEDAPPQPPEPQPVVPEPVPDGGEEEDRPEEEEEDLPLEDEGVVWAKRKYGDEPEKWARAARDMEAHISRLTAEKRESDELAQSWYEYAQQIEAQQSQLGGGMPLSAQEEQWIEGALLDPLGYARNAALNGKTQLYNGVINRIAEENPGLAAQVGAQVQMELAQLAAQQQQQPQAQPSLQDSLGQSFQRLGIDLKADGPRMSAKLGELGEYHPYVRAILEGDDAQRDLAVRAVYDLVRASSFSTRRVASQQNLEREQELRREAAVVQTGGIAPPPTPPRGSAFVDAMEDEWRRAGQWPDE